MGGGVAAIVPAAGLGRRLGGRTSKLFVPICGRPLLAYTLQALQESPAVQWIIPVIRAEDRRAVAALVSRERIGKALTTCLGGRSRAESVARGVAAVPPQAGWVLVHDAARPCVSSSLIDAVVQAARRHGAAACGLPASVTIKAVDEHGQVRLTLDREHVWLVQTPQVFRRDWFAQALEASDHRLDRFTDDAALVEAAGLPVQMVAGDPLNLKVTTREDLVLAEAILMPRDARCDVRSWKLEVRKRRHGRFTAGRSPRGRTLTSNLLPSTS